MPARSLLLAPLLCCFFSAALAQTPARFPIRRGVAASLALAAPAPEVALVAVVGPTVQAAKAYAPLLPPASLPPTAAPAEPVGPRPGLPTTVVAPGYDLYQNWPEAQRKVTLPAPYTEPLPLQLLRGVLGR